jgi:MFS transporter, ACS family, hexuronate transporter
VRAARWFCTFDGMVESAEQERAAGVVPGRSAIARSAWGVLAFAVVAQIGISVVDQGLPALTGFIKGDLHISAARAGLLVSSFSLGRILGSYTAGRAADRFGERTVLATGGIGGGLLAILASISPLWLLIGLLCATGMFCSSATPAGGRIVLLAFPRDRHGLALGLRQTGIPLGGLIAAVTLPSIAHVLSWRWSLAVGGLSMMALTSPIAFLRRGEGRTARAAGETHHGPNPLKNRSVLLLSAWGALLVSGNFALLSFLALDLHQRARLTLASGSLLLAVAQVGGFAGRVGWGALSDRLLTHGRKPLMFVVTGVGLLASLLLLAVPGSAGIGVFIALAGLAGLAVIGFQGLLVTMVAEAAGPVRVGAATGIMATAAQISIFVSPPLYGLVADITGSYRSIWAALAVVIGVSLVPAILIREHEHVAPSGPSPIRR